MNTSRLINRVLTPMIISAVLALSNTWANAEPPARDDSPPKPGPGFIPELPGLGLPPHFANLELTEAQEDKIFYRLHAEAPAIRNNIKQQRKLREEIDKLITTTNLDEKRARQLASELARVQTDAIFSRISTESRIRSLLTQEQLVKLDEKREFGKGREHRSPPTSKSWESRQREDLPKPI